MEMLARTIAISIIALSALSPLPAQQPAAAAGTPEQPKKATLEGIVVHAMTKEPVRRADITLIPMPDGGRGRGGGRPGSGPGPAFSIWPETPNSRRVTTDATGKYVFTDVDPGRYMVRAQRNGFLASTYGQRNPGAMGMSGTPLEVEAGESLRELRILLTPQAVIAGRVLDDEGEPVQNLIVQVLSNQLIRGKRQFAPRGGAQTNDRGEFRLTNVAPGSVYLQISPPGRGAGGGTPRDTAVEQDYVPMYYPGVFDAAQALKIDVTPGAELSGFEMKLQKRRVFSITGRVVDEATGQSPRNYFVNLMPRDVPFFGIAAQQFNRMPDGSFRIGGVAPGSYNLQISAGDGRGGMQGRLNHSEPIDVGDANVSGLVVRLPQPVTVAGRVITKAGATKIDLRGVRVSPVQGPLQMGFRPPATTEDDGSFNLESISPGKYQLNISGLSSGYVESIRYGTVDVTGAEFEVSSAGVPLTITVATDGGGVLGTVRKGEDAMGGIPVQLVPTDKAKRNSLYVKSTQTDQTGGFSLMNIAPGSYYVIAPEDADAGFWEDDEIFRRLEGRFAKVDVQKNGSHSLEVKAVTVN